MAVNILEEMWILVSSPHWEGSVRVILKALPALDAYDPISPLNHPLSHHKASAPERTGSSLFPKYA